MFKATQTTERPELFDKEINLIFIDRNTAQWAWWTLLVANGIKKMSSSMQRQRKVAFSRLKKPSFSLLFLCSAKNRRCHFFCDVAFEKKNSIPEICPLLGQWSLSRFVQFQQHFLFSPPPFNYLEYMFLR